MFARGTLPLRGKQTFIWFASAKVRGIITSANYNNQSKKSP